MSDRSRANWDSISNPLRDDTVGGSPRMRGGSAWMPSLQIDDGMFEVVINNSSKREKNCKAPTGPSRSSSPNSSPEPLKGFVGPKTTASSKRPADRSEGAFRLCCDRRDCSSFGLPSTARRPTFAHEMGHIFWAIDELRRRGKSTTTHAAITTHPTPKLSGQPRTPGVRANQTIIMAGWRFPIRAGRTRAKSPARPDHAIPLAFGWRRLRRATRHFDVPRRAL